MIKLFFKIVYVVFTVIEGLLALRFVFKLLHLPGSVPAVGWVYSVTNFIVQYFMGTGLRDFSFMGFYVESATFIAVIAFAILAGITRQLISNI